MRSVALLAFSTCAASTVYASTSVQQAGEAIVHLLQPASASTASQAATTDKATASKISYTPSDTNVLLSSFLGIEEYEVLRSGLEIPHQLTFPPLNDDVQNLEDVAANKATPLLIVAEQRKFSEEESVLSSASRLLHSFRVQVPPSSNAWLELFSTYGSRIAEKFGGPSQASEDYKVLGMASFPLVPGSFGQDMAYNSGFDDEIYAPFLESIRQLAMIQDGPFDKHSVQTIELRGLHDIARKYGKESTEFLQASDIFDTSLKGVIASYPSKIVYVSTPADSGHLTQNQRKRRSGVDSSIFSTRIGGRLSAKRQESPPPTVATPLVPTTGQCYDDQDSCSNSTSSCFGHGQCIQGRRVGVAASQGECWVCACGKTSDNGKTQYWSGSMCQKEDVSSPFFLLAGTGFLLVFVSVASIALLSQAGGEALPSTLAALGGGTGHRKHD